LFIANVKKKCDYNRLTNMSGRLNLFGIFALEYAGTPVAIASPRIQAFLAYLALHRREPQSRQQLAFVLWPDSSDSQAYTNLRTLLHRAQAVLPHDIPLLQIDSQTVTWHPDAAMKLDVAEFEAEIDRANVAAQRDGAAACVALEQAINLYQGDLLPDCYDEWILPERDRLRQMFLTALERLISLLEQERRYAIAVSYAQRLAHLDPFNEAVCLTLMRLHTIIGDRASALRVYHQCASTLQAELGVAPSVALSGAYERLLTAEALPPSDSPLSATAPLVGRDQEWKRIQAIWQVVISGRPRLLILSGEAGIGKTRLAEDLLRWATRQGFITALTQCYPAEGDLAYSPVMALLRSDALRPGLALLAPEWRTEIARLAPDLVATASDIPPPSPVAESWQRQRLFEALARLVLAAKRPTLLVIDDLQWCDHDTLEWLHFLLRFDPNARLLVLSAVRTEEIGTSHPIAQLTEALRGEGRVTEIALNRLSHKETTTLAEHIIGHPLQHEHADMLFMETEGNPLFIVETLRAETKTSLEGEALETGAQLSEKSAVVPPDLPPRTLAIIAQRLSRLSPEAHELMDVAAVIGRSFGFAVLAHVTDLSENDLVRGLDELWQRRILREQGSSAYDFTHGKLCEVAYAELSAARRHVLHRRVAEALEEIYAAEMESISGQVAAHYEQAGMFEHAVVYYRRAASHARYLYANDAAIDYHQRALALMTGAIQTQEAGICDELGEVLHLVGRYGEARDVWRRAMDSTPGQDRLTRANLHRKLGNAWRDQYHFDEALHEYDAAEDALSKLDRDDEATWSCWGEIKLDRINLLYWLGQLDGMLRLLDEIRQVFEQRGSLAQRARLHQTSAITLLRQNRYSPSSQAIEHARAYLDLVKEMLDANALPAAHFQLGFVALWGSEDLDLAEEHIREALSLADRRGDISLLGRCFTYLTVVARQRGQVEQARSYAEQGLEVAVSGQMNEYIGAAQGNLAWAAWRSGDDAAAHIHGQAALDAWQQYKGVYMFEWIGRWPLLAMVLAENDLAKAVVHAHVLLDERQKRMPSAIESALEAALQMQQAGNEAASRSFLETAVELASEHRYL
jgi:DNA-binding SARP family transcriptional activator